MAGKTGYYQGSLPSHAKAVTPNDSVDLDTSGTLYIGAGGDVKVDTQSGDTVTFVNVPQGTWIPTLISRVYATGTTASSIIVGF